MTETDAITQADLEVFEAYDRWQAAEKERDKRLKAYHDAMNRAATLRIESIHGVVRVPRDLWAKVRNIPSDRLPTGTWEAIQAIGRD